MPTTITGTDGVSQVQAGAVESGDLASGAIGSGDLPAGSVIQVKHVVTRVNAETTSNDVIFDLGLSISITPRDVNSKFLLLAKINARTHESGYALLWFRNGSAVRTQGEDFERFNRAASHNPGHHQYFDEPATTSTITYEAKPKSYIEANNVVFSSSGHFDHNLTVMEIAG